MRESILLFHISDKEVKKKVERALLPLRVRLRHITLKDYSQPLGVLAGLPDMTPSEEIYDGEELSDTMIVFCGLSNQKLDQALLALKKKRCGTVSVQSDPHTDQSALARKRLSCRIKTRA